MEKPPLSARADGDDVGYLIRMVSGIVRADSWLERQWRIIADVDFDASRPFFWHLS